MKFVLIWLALLQTPDGKMQDSIYNFGIEMTYQQCQAAATIAEAVKPKPINGAKMIFDRFYCVQLPPNKKEDGIPT